MESGEEAGKKGKYEYSLRLSTLPRLIPASRKKHGIKRLRAGLSVL
jgi:hypothetical protein